MRKSIGLSVAVLVIVMVLISGTAFAVDTDYGKVSGPHWNINIIGHPKDYKGSGETSDGHSIMIPLKTEAPPDYGTCTGQGVDLDFTEGPTSAPASGTRIYFVGGDTFDILDRDATDGEARIQLPVDMALDTRDLKFDLYMRVLGKPNQCMNIYAYAYATDTQGQTLWYKTGTVTVSRGKGKQSFVRATDLFNIWWCTQMEGSTCLSTANLSVFATIFSGYFWQILNDGTRLVQMRIYPTN